MNGILNILKPPGMTSHDVVAVVRRKLRTPRVGHTGTLDPMAAGVLPVCVGQATRVVEWLQEDRKGYRAEMLLGMETDTQDRWGTILESRDVSVSEEDIRQVFERYVGDILQVPPMYSALKVNGKKLCDLARAGITVEREARKQTIHSIRLISVEGKRVLFDVDCSKGTYIRTLIHDIGQELGTGACMSFLLRTSTGEFSLRDAVTLETLKSWETPEQAEPFLHPIQTAFSKQPSVALPPDRKVHVQNGVKMELSRYLKKRPECDTLVQIYIEGQFVALGWYDAIQGTLFVRRHFLGAE